MSKQKTNAVQKKNCGKKNNVRTPVQSRSIKVKERIILAAYDLFGRKRYHDVSMRMVAQKAGVHVGSIYSYFKDKQEIFMAVSTHYGIKMYQLFFETLKNDIQRTDSIEEAILKIIYKLREMILQNYTLHMETIILSMADKRIEGHYVLNESYNANKISELFEQRFKGKIKTRKNDPEAARLVVHKAIEEIVQYCLCFKPEISEDRIYRETARMIAAYLEND